MKHHLFYISYLHSKIINYSKKEKKLSIQVSRAWTASISLTWASLVIEKNSSTTACTQLNKSFLSEARQT